MKKLLVAAFAAICVGASAFADVVCQIGDTPYNSLDDALVAAQHGDMIVLADDVVIAKTLVLSDYDFAGIDLNGHDLTTGGYFWNGTDYGPTGAYDASDNPIYGPVPTLYGKRIIVPDGSTLTVGGQFCFNGARSTLEIRGSGKVIGNAHDYSLKWSNLNVSFFGSSDEARIIATGAQARFVLSGGSEINFDADALESARTVAPIDIQATESQNLSGAYLTSIVVGGAGCALIEEPTDVNLVKSRFVCNVSLSGTSWINRTDDEGGVLTYVLTVPPGEAVYVDAEGEVIAGFGSFVGAIDAARNGVTTYAGATLKLMQDVEITSWYGNTSAGNANYNLTDANFAVLDLNGKNLSVSGNFWNGGDDGPATYAKKFVIPEDSSLTVGSQFKMNGLGNEIEIAGMIDLTGQWHNFPNVLFTFKGPHPRICLAGSGSGSYFGINYRAVFDFEGVDSVYEYAPVTVDNAGAGTVNCVSFGQVFLKNIDDMPDDAVVPLASGPAEKKVVISDGNLVGFDAAEDDGYGTKTLYADISRFGLSVNGLCYPSFNKVLAAVQHGDMIKLVKDVSSDQFQENGYVAFNDKDFAGIDLNGHNLTFTSSLVNGNESPVAYGKKIIVPVGSTLTFEGQCKMNVTGDQWNEFIVGGTVNAPGNWHNFYGNFKFTVLGPDACIRYSGSNFIIPADGKLVYDFTGVNEPWVEAPIQITDGNYDAKCYGTVEYVNYEFESAVDVPLMAVPEDRNISFPGIDPVVENGQKVIYKTLEHVGPVENGLTYETAFRSIAAYNEAVVTSAFAGQDIYLILDGVNFAEGTDYSLAGQSTPNAAPDPAQAKPHLFFYNCTFNGGLKGKMNPTGGPGSDVNGGNRKEIALCTAKEVVVGGCSFAAYTGDSYVIDLNLYNWFANEGCGVTITNNTFAAGAGNRCPISVKNKVAIPPAFVLIEGNTFNGISSNAYSEEKTPVICFGDQSTSTTTAGGANFPVTIQNNTYACDEYAVLSGAFVGSGKEKVFVDDDEAFAWAYDSDKAAWTSSPVKFPTDPNGIVAEEATVGTVGFDGDGNFVISFTGTAGATYVLKKATSLTAPITWTTVQEIMATGSVQDATPITPDGDAGFYKLEIK